MPFALARRAGRGPCPKTSGRCYDKADDDRTVSLLFVGPMVSSFEELVRGINSVPYALHSC